jgi:hypothetical protein
VPRPASRKAGVWVKSTKKHKSGDISAFGFTELLKNGGFFCDVAVFLGILGVRICGYRPYLKKGDLP